MNIMLASILERTREIGLAALSELASLISSAIRRRSHHDLFRRRHHRVVFGFIISRLIAWLAGWSTIVTFSSIALAFLVSISVGLIFGIYPATKAARLDPVRPFAMNSRPSAFTSSAHRSLNLPPLPAISRIYGVPG